MVKTTVDSREHPQADPISPRAHRCCYVCTEQRTPLLTCPRSRPPVAVSNDRTRPATPRADGKTPLPTIHSVALASAGRASNAAALHSVFAPLLLSLLKCQESENGSLRETRHPDASFVPLTHKHEQQTLDRPHLVDNCKGRRTMGNRCWEVRNGLCGSGYLRDR